MKQNTLLDVFHKASGNTNQSFYTKDRFKFFRPEAFSEIYQKAERLAVFFLQNGLKKGDRVSVLSDNRLEWMIADMGILLAGGITVPRGSDSNEKEIEFILRHSESSFVLIEHLRLYKKLSKLLSTLKIPILVLDPNFPESEIEKNQFFSLHKILKKPISSGDQNVLQKIKNETKGSDLFTIIYTSGTTGNPKGVMLSHSNMMYQLEVVPNVIDIEKGDDYSKLTPVVLVGILDFEYFKGNSYLTRHLILNVETLENELKDINFIFIEIPKFKKELNDCKSLTDKWIYFIKNE